MLVVKTYFFFILLSVISITNGTILDDSVPEILKRVEGMKKVLLPVPNFMLDIAMRKVASFYVPVNSQTELCRNHSVVLVENFLKQQIWALKMIDASSKVGPGLLDGNMIDLGSYDECVAVTAPENLFTGKHCVIETQGFLPPELDFNGKKEAFPRLRVGLVFSVCVPSSCSSRDVKTHMDVALNSVNASAIIYNSSCSTRHPIPFTTTDYCTLLLILVLIILILVSSYFDYNTSDKEKRELWLSFSVRHNVRQMINCSQSSDSVSCLHGIRVLAMFWIILGHRNFHLILLPNLRYNDVLENISSPAWAPLQEAGLSVEVFFLLSGTLVAYNLFKGFQRNKPLNYFKHCINRYLRLTPTMAAVVLLYASLLVHASDGPIFHRIFDPFHQACVDYWWTSLLYIANYYNPHSLCNFPSWYLNADFQLHLLAPLVLLLLYKKRIVGYFLIVLALLGSLVANMANAYFKELPAGGYITADQKAGDQVSDGYFYTHFKAGSFLIGILLGCFIYKIKSQQLCLCMSKLQLFLGWVIAIGFMVISIFGVTYFLDERHIYNPWIDSTFYVLHKCAIVLGVSWIIIVCTSGYGGIVNSVLSWNKLLPLSRLTYGAYLLHWTVQAIQAYRTRTPVTADIFNVVYLVAADYTISYILAALLFLMVESPIANLINAFSARKEPTAQVDNIHHNVIDFDRKANKVLYRY